MNEISDLDGKERESMGFALKEILMNAMEYGGKFNRERLVEASRMYSPVNAMHHLPDTRPR